MKKVVPIIIRKQGQKPEVLAFHHPLAGTQLVKGTIEKNEIYEKAAIRELYEESGLIAQPYSQFMGKIFIQAVAQEWYFYLCHVNEIIPDSWVHHCQDNGGLDFKFFWHPLHEKVDETWHKSFQEALTFIAAYWVKT